MRKIEKIKEKKVIWDEGFDDEFFEEKIGRWNDRMKDNWRNDEDWSNKRDGNFWRKKSRRKKKEKREDRINLEEIKNIYLWIIKILIFIWWKRNLIRENKKIG